MAENIACMTFISISAAFVIIFLLNLLISFAYKPSTYELYSLIIQLLSKELELRSVIGLPLPRCFLGRCNESSVRLHGGTRRR